MERERALKAHAQRVRNKLAKDEKSQQQRHQAIALEGLPKPDTGARMASKPGSKPKRDEADLQALLARLPGPAAVLAASR